MTVTLMSSLERVLTTLEHREPDRVPLFLPVTMHGALELGLSLEDYYASGENVAEGQLRLRAKYGDDFVSTFFYAAVEQEAFGGHASYFDDGPPNAGEPVIRSDTDLWRLEPPKVRDSPSLTKVLRATELLHDALGGDAVIVGVAMSPFSLPVMQMGFERYLDLLYGQPELFERLMQVNEEFCVEWANAQLGAGATAIGYFDPVSSPTIVPKSMFLETGLKVAQRTLGRIKGPVAALFASGTSLPLVHEMAGAGAAILGVSSDENLSEAKDACRGRVTVLGNLNGIEMRHWSDADAEAAVKDAIRQTAPGGGFILSDTHGEIPYQVPEQVLHAIADAARSWGQYPLTWLDDD